MLEICRLQIFLFLGGGGGGRLLFRGRIRGRLREVLGADFIWAVFSGGPTSPDTALPNMSPGYFSTPIPTETQNQNNIEIACIQS